MIKQIALLGFLVVVIAGTVFVIQKSTLLRSFGYDVVDLTLSFHHSEGDPEFNSNLDVYRDGIINVLDILKDRYLQEASRSGNATGSGVLRVIESTNSAESSRSANPI